MLEKSFHIELETPSDYKILAIASMARFSNSDVQKAQVKGEVSTLLQIPKGITETDAIEEYFENLGFTYFMERFLETALMNQGMSGQVIRTQDNHTILRCGSWNCPVEFIYEETEKAHREEYWRAQEESGNPESDRTLLYVDKNLIDNKIIPIIDSLIEHFDPKNDKFDEFIRKSILSIMLSGGLHGNGIQFNAASSSSSNSHKILKKYKDAADSKKQTLAKKILMKKETPS